MIFKNKVVELVNPSGSETVTVALVFPLKSPVELTVSSASLTENSKDSSSLKAEKVKSVSSTSEADN